MRDAAKRSPGHAPRREPAPSGAGLPVSTVSGSQRRNPSAGSPTIYNRLWHLDTDGRRHHGKRRWDPGAIDAIIDLAGTIDFLYPPDFSDKDLIRFRASGQPTPVAELATSNPRHLELRLLLRDGMTIARLRDTLRLPLRKASSPAGPRCQINIIGREQVNRKAFATLFGRCALGSGRAR